MTEEAAILIAKTTDNEEKIAKKLTITMPYRAFLFLAVIIITLVTI